MKFAARFCVWLWLVNFCDCNIYTFLKNISIVEQKKKNFRSMEEIKAELEGSMGWNIKSDVQIMRDIVDLLKSDKKTREEKMVALDSLEDYAHQIDNGKDLEKIGGLKVIVNMLNKSDEIMQEKAANVIGAAAQR